MRFVRFSGFFILLFTLFISLVYSVEIEVSISENTNVRELLNGQYSVDAQGELVLYNPSNTSSVYEFTIPFDLDSLIGISKITLDNSSDNFAVDFERIKGRYLDPNETIRMGYRIYGLVPFNIFDNLTQENISVFEYYNSGFSFLSQSVVGLQKPEREGFTYNISGNLTGTPSLNETPRLVSVIIQNPTDFLYDVREISLYRAQAGSYGSPVVSHFSEGTLLNTFTEDSILPLDNLTLDYYDTTSFDNVVYWVSSDITVRPNVSSNVSKSFSVETPSSGGGGGGSSGGGSGSGTTTTDPESEEVIESLLIKKSTDKTVVRSGEEVTVILQIVNINDFSISDLDITDFVPEGYELIEASRDIRFSQGEIKFSVSEINAYETEVFTYTLSKKEDLRGITYLNPAILKFEGETLFSQGVILINEILENQRLFVQKDVKYVDNEFARVTIKVKNLGSTEIRDILVRENLPENLLIREISQALEERGVWKIERLGAGDEWEVTFLVQRGDGIEALPSVFGVDQSSIFGTVVVSEEVITRFGQSRSTNTVEKVGLGFAILLLVGFLLY